MTVPDGPTTPPDGGVFHVRTQVMSPDDVGRAIRRIAHEIIERNRGLDDVVVIGLAAGGIWFAEAIVDAIEPIAGHRVPIGTLDVAFYRDDIALRPVRPASVSSIAVDLTAKIVVLADDVLFTGRTIRAALNAINDYGRPKSVQLAVAVDRGHRELPIRADFVGKNLPTRRDEEVRATAAGVEIGDMA